MPFSIQGYGIEIRYKLLSDFEASQGMKPLPLSPFLRRPWMGQQVNMMKNGIAYAQF